MCAIIQRSSGRVATPNNFLGIDWSVVINGETDALTPAL
jgi:hypothetical protein